MRLTNVYRVDDDKASNIYISGSKIIAGDVDFKDDLQLVFNNAVAFPGIINSHDHLDFNLFPQLGNGIYNNYTEWGAFIHQHYKQEISDILNIPSSLRTQWGLYKNLLCGVTTVVNHGHKLHIENSPITVLANERSIHSVQLEKRWQLRLNHPFKGKAPVVIHIGEGTDQLAATEIDTLIHWNLLHRKLIAVHGVAMTAKQAGKFKALVWCPESNLYLLGKTAAISNLKKHLSILFGTDSTLTGNWNIWHHIRLAKKTGLLTDDELLKHLSLNPGRIWGINTGQLQAGFDADIVIARKKENNEMRSTFFETNPADILLVLHKGNICLFDEMLYSQLGTLPTAGYSKINIGGATKYVIGDLPGLINNIQQYHPTVQFPVTFN